MKRYYLYALGVISLMTSCFDEQFEIVYPAESGSEVHFAAKLVGTHKTKTTYGEDLGDQVKVNWINEDLIYVYGENCLTERNQAEYQVTPAYNEEEGYSYAESLNKTGSYGVQWGDTASDFYAIYPSSPSTKFTPLTNEQSVVTGASVATRISNVQNNRFIYNSTKNTWEGHEININGVPTMEDAIMYAYSSNVAPGSVANLRFKSLSTVLKFTLDGVRTENGLGEGATVYVQRVVITSPENTKIVGDFNLKIDKEGNATIGEIANSSNIVTVNTLDENGDGIPVLPEQKISFNLFILPIDKLSLNGWKATIYTSHGSKTITFNKGDLNSGEIHKITVPELNSLPNNFTFEPDKWISQLPPTIYLSEVSVPGAWYSTDNSYQATTNLTEQFAAGIRAFNIDCRLSPREDAGFLQAAPTYSNTDAINASLQLTCSGTEDATSASYEAGETVKSKLQTLSNLILQNPNEYIVVILTIAEKPCDYKKTFSSSRVSVGTVDPVLVLDSLDQMLSSATAAKWNIYGNKEGEIISANTTVDDVRGKMIIKINSNASDFNDKNKYPSIDNATVSFASMALPTYNLQNDNITDLPSGYFNTYQTANMYWGQNITSPLVKYQFHQAQRTTSSIDRVNVDLTASYPSLGMRMNAVENLIQNSWNLYNVKPTLRTHDTWFQIGIGGSKKDNNETEDHAIIAETLNTFLYNKVMAKMGYAVDENGNVLLDSTNKEPYLDPNVSKQLSPVGIVLMNYCTNPSGKSYNGPELINAILKLNSMFYMERSEESSGQ